MTQFELYVKLGYEHILDPRLFSEPMAAEGYDHLLFIVALAAIYQFKEYKQVLILVTAFTIGHSITLLLSTLNIVSVSMAFIEFLIPLTIVLTAIFNLVKYKNIASKQALRLRYGAALVFGFIHGLGFSNYLKSLLGKEESIIVPLLGFNIGLELGQILIVIGILLLYFGVEKLTALKRATWIWVVSLIVLAFSLPILWRAFNVIG